VPGGRIELPTQGFSGPCSTTELPWHKCIILPLSGLYPALAGLAWNIFLFITKKLTALSIYIPVDKSSKNLLYVFSTKKQKGATKLKQLLFRKPII
jgi:hypothetical protein